LGSEDFLLENLFTQYAAVNEVISQEQFFRIVTQLQPSAERLNPEK
jgi:hypothetical protein